MEEIHSSKPGQAEVVCRCKMVLFLLYGKEIDAETLTILLITLSIEPLRNSVLQGGFTVCCLCPR